MVTEFGTAIYRFAEKSVSTTTLPYLLTD